MRFEVWFNNGLFRGFPNVKEESIKRSEDFISFVFGKEQTHRADINIRNINFMEAMKDSEEES